MGEKPQVKIKQWYILDDRLYGKTYGHPRFDDGTSVVTSRILNQDDNMVETMNTIYELQDEYNPGGDWVPQDV